MCDYFSCNKTDFDRHCDTIKHKNRFLETNGNKKNEKNELFICNICGKDFMSNSGLWKHEKSCKGSTTSIDSTTNLILDKLVKSQMKIAHMITQNNNDFQRMIIELCKNTTNITQQNTMINNNNIQQNNNTFNLNLFLNETCKDAMNLSDFIKGVKVSIDDIEHIGKVGYVDGLSDLIIKNLNELGVERRPIHCTDAKRQIVYVKEDDKWEKEDESMSRLKKMVCGVQHANFATLKKWREMYPSCLTANSIYTDTYNTMSQELMGGDCEKISLSIKDLKIISKVARGMTIDKTALVSL